MVAKLSVVIVTYNEAELLRATLEAFWATTADAEYVVVDDCSVDGSADFLERERRSDVTLRRSPRRLGVAAARNLGARVARAPVLVFSDAHVEPQEGWAPAVLDALSEPSTAVAAPAVTDLRPSRSPAGYGFTWTEPSLAARWLTGRPAAASPVPFVSGCFMATPRGMFGSLGGFDEGMHTWGYEDAEYSLRAWLSGYRCVVTPDATVAHRFRSEFSYEVAPATVLHNRLRMGVLHLSAGPLSRLFADARRYAEFPAALEQLMTSDVWRSRDRVRAGRRRSDDWFFDRFCIRALGDGLTTRG
jgi:GT2 family glycosyltransferase